MCVADPVSLKLQLFLDFFQAHYFPEKYPKTYKSSMKLGKNFISVIR